MPKRWSPPAWMACCWSTCRRKRPMRTAVPSTPWAWHWCCWPRRPAAQGYLYYVSFAGVTGASERLDSTAAGERLRLLRSRTKTPVVAGFGIKDAASAAAMAVDADGVVVGSALVATMAGAESAEEAARRAAAFLNPLRQALDA